MFNWLDDSSWAVEQLGCWAAGLLAVGALGKRGALVIF